MNGNPYTDALERLICPVVHLRAVDLLAKCVGRDLGVNHAHYLG